MDHPLRCLKGTPVGAAVSQFHASTYKPGTECRAHHTRAKAVAPEDLEWDGGADGQRLADAIRGYSSHGNRFDEDADQRRQYAEGKDHGPEVHEPGDVLF